MAFLAIATLGVGTVKPHSSELLFSGAESKSAQNSIFARDEKRYARQESVDAAQ
jgi:hypothetical protein